MKTASRIQIALTLVGVAAFALVSSATAQTERYRSGAGTWDTTTTNWGTASGGPYTTTWSSSGNATFEGTVGTVTLAAPVSVNNLTFTSASNGYTISGATLNFVTGGVITQSIKNKKHTITSALTGSPSVNVADGTTYEGLTFAPTSGSVTLGTCTVPYENGGGDKAGLILDGTTTGNSAGTVQYASGNLYGTLWKKGAGTWTVGNVDIGTVEIDVGTLVANGAVNTYYQGLKFIGGTLKGTGPINTAVTVPAAGNLSPGITNGTLSITAALNISAMANGTGKLNYDLATPATSDKIAVTGSAVIGTGVLGFNDFVFTNLGGMQAGVYTLITTTTGITGTLDSANLSGTVGGFPGTLQINGNNLEWVTSGFEMNIQTRSPADDATTARAYEALTVTFSKPVAIGSGNITLRNLTNATDTVIPVGDSRLSVSGSMLTIHPGSALQWNKNYAVRIDATAIDSTTGLSFAGISDDTTWNFSTLTADPLVDALSALKNHITGAITLSDAQIAAHKLTIDAEKNYFATNAAAIAAALDLVTTYDTVLGPLFVSRSLPVRASVTNDIHWTLYTVMQDLMDFTYNASNITNNYNLLNGFKFGSSASFPGSCPPPADPNVTHSAIISASYLNTAGRETQGDGVGTFARKPTGTYLAPGSIATVTVPAALVNMGFKIRVGAQSSDLSNRPTIRRLERSSLVYDITALATQIASPLGGGIYIEVPWLASAGTVSVQIKNAVRSPYFSAKGIQTTTPAQWLTERTSPAPWADFQTDKFMMQVPTSWISAMPDPTQLMADWDASMDASTDLMGFPRLRGKESFYLQVDVDLKNSFFSPGYPAVNVGGFNSSTDYGGYNSSHYLVRGPQWVSNPVTNVEFHEQGHGFFFPKFPGEVESAVNLLYVPVLHQKFGFSLDEAFRSSLGYTNTFQTLDTTAIAWMTVFNFSPREAAMAAGEKSYQLKGHAKYVDVARLFGWDKLKAFHATYVENANGTSYTTDQLLLNLCNAVGKDIRPLFAFWGIYPENPTTLASSIAAAGLPPSREIYNALLHYETLVPANNAAFQSFAFSWWGRQPSITGAWEEREHARQWDTTPLYSAGDQQRSEVTNPGEIYNENSANDIRNRIHELLALYYPSGIPLGAGPAAVTDSALWLDASQLTGLTDGDTVPSWSDTSGNGNHASATGTSATYQTGALNGKPVVRFNTDGNTSFNFNEDAAIRTVFWVVKNTYPGMHFMLGHSAAYDFHAGDSTLWHSTFANYYIKTGTTKLMGTVVDGTAITLPSASYSLVSLVTTGDVRANMLTSDRGISGRSWAGDIAELLVYNRVLSSAEELAVGSYLANKYGLGTAYNNPPVANSQSINTTEDTAKPISLTAIDADGNPLTYTIVAPPAHGTISGIAPNVTYTPVLNYNGADSFTFKVNDGTIDSANATVSITVNPGGPAITIDAQISAKSAGSATINLTAEFQTSVNASNKLVVMTSGRGAGGSNYGKSLTSIQYGSTFLVPAINVRSNDVSPTAGGEEVAAIYYLDNPGNTPATTITITYAGGMDTSSGYTVLALSGTAPGVSVANGGVTAGSVMSGSTTLTTTVANSLVLAVGAADRASTTPQSPLSLIYNNSVSPGGTYGSGSQAVAMPGLISPTFTYSAAKTTPVTVAAAFAPVGPPLPWVRADIGTGMLAGSASYSSGTFTQTGSGIIGTTSDKLCFTYQTLTGDGEIIARISVLQNTGTSSRVGVMIRDTLANNSKQIFMGMSGSNGYRWVRRTTTGGSNTTTASSTGTVPNTWVRLVRSGTTITAYKSADGTSWTTVGSTTGNTFASTCYIGLAISSGSTTTLNTSQFTNLSVTP